MASSRYNMGTEVYPFRDMQVVDYGDIPCNPFNIPKVTCFERDIQWTPDDLGRG